MSKVALVTGGSRGIGFGIAEKLAAEKWDIVINGVREEAAVAEHDEELRIGGVGVAGAGHADGAAREPEHPRDHDGGEDGGCDPAHPPLTAGQHGDRLRC